MKNYKFNQKADKELDRVYFDCPDTKSKIKKLDEILGGQSNFYAFPNGEITDDMKLGCLEYEYLGNLGLIKVKHY